MINLKNKKILFISTSFFEYENKIKNKLLEFGAYVDYFDERPFKNTFLKALLKINPILFKSITIKYFNIILKNIETRDYDYVFIIKCEIIPISILKKFKKNFKSAKFILYLYDSINNIIGIEPKFSYFDSIFTFDMQDVNNFPNLIFRPLFFIDNLKSHIEFNTKIRYDISFIGTIHSDRLKIIKKIEQLCEKNGYNYFFYPYLQAKFIYYFYRLIKSEFRNTNIFFFKFKKLDTSDLVKIINSTKVILDIQHPKQTGLTMRTIETIALRKKIITTNNSIMSYDFYHPNNVHIISRNEVAIPKDFLESPFREVNDEIVNRYSLESWIIEIFSQ
jgi:hypothetical protein